MKYTSKKLENKNMQFEITISKQEWEHALNDSYNHNKNKYAIEGFRKGKAPRKVIEKNYGENVFLEDALHHAFSHAYTEILTNEKDLEVVDTPTIDIKEMNDDGVVIVAEVTVMPEVKLGKYKGLGLKKEVKQVSEEDINKELATIQERNMRMIEVEDADVNNGHIVNIDFSGSIDGELFDGGSATGFDLEIGSKSFIDNFEEQLVGLKTGDKKDVEVTFPTNYHAKELAGKKAVFAVTINTIKEKQLPEINDEFASDVSKHETLEDYKKEISEKLQKQFDNEAHSEIENKVLDAIVEDLTVDVPEVMVDQENEAILKDMENRLMYQGITLEDYAKYLNTTIEKIKEERRDHALKSVKVRLALQEIIKAEKIEVTDKELDERLTELAKSMKQSLNEFKKTITEERVGYLKNDILINKLLQFLVNNNTVK